jgi:hypothetical protein
LESERLDALDAAAWITCMRRGDFDGAWASSDRMRGRRQDPPDWTLPRHLQQIWDGTPLGGRRVLVRCYHGLGDTLQFIRYAPLLRRIARQVIVWAQPSLLPLLGTVEGIDLLLPLHDGAPEVEYDVDIEVMELPYAFRTTPATIPTAVPYLRATPATLREPSPRIAIFWRAGDWNPSRSVPFQVVHSLLSHIDASWFTSLPGQTADEPYPDVVLASPSDLASTAQLLCACELVISVDTVFAHLAGALGRRTWTLLPYDADWRWMEARDDSPWYPTMRLFRQSHPGDWASVIADLRRALMDEINGGGTRP